jgi:hypothetical protein
MIGQSIHCSGRFGIRASILLIVGLGLLALAVALQNVQPLVGSAFPLLAVLLWWWMQPRSLSLHFSEEALEVAEPPLTIPYEAIQGVRVQGKPKKPAFLIELLHENGVVRIPPSREVSSKEIYAFLHGRIAGQSGQPVSRALSPFYDDQVRQFGGERVWTFAARKATTGKIGSSFASAFSLAAWIAGLVWIVYGVSNKGMEYWVGFGVLLTLVGLFVFAISRISSADRYVKVKNRHQAGIVIGPSGLAMVQGDITGQMRWEELRDVRPPGKAKSFVLSNAAPHIRLQVPGAMVPIFDIYDRPLPAIYEKIVQYWRPPG